MEVPSIYNRVPYNTDQKTNQKIDTSRKFEEYSDPSEKSLQGRASWWSEHSGAIKDTSIKIGLVAAAIILIPVLIVGGIVVGGIAAGSQIAKVYKKRYNTTALDIEAHKLKKTEETQKLKFLTKKETLESGKLVLPLSSLTPEDKAQLIEIATQRLILKSIKSNGSEITPIMIDDIKGNNKGSIKSSSLWKEQEKEIHNKIADMRRVLSDDEALSRKNEDFNEKFNNFVNTLKKHENSVTDHPKSANQEILKAFRAVLETPMYDLLKEDNSSGHIQFLHKFAAGLWNGFTMMPEFSDFGKKVLDKVGKDAICKNEGNGAEVAGILEKSIRAADKDLHSINKKRQSVLHMITHPNMVLGSLAGEGGIARHIAGLFGQTEYDPSMIGNNSFLQGTTTTTLNGNNVNIDYVYGASPTTGNGDKSKIAPEFKAVLQAAENNQFGKAKVEGIPDVILYTNFQNILTGKKGEGSRSIEIMKLNNEFPLSFVGLTLSKDSDFYGVKKDGEAIWPGTQAFGEEMQEHLLNDVSFQLENRGANKEQDKGFYFPGSQEEWKTEIIPAVLAKANQFFSAYIYERYGHETDHSPSEVRHAYQEFVYMMLSHYLEMKVANDLTKRGIKNVLVQSHAACKEDVDRGGSVQTANLWLHLKGLNSSEDKEDTFMNTGTGGLIGRPVLARDRVILDYRPVPLFDFMKNVDPKKFFNSLNELLEENKMKSTGSEFKVASR
jgi:hypothetical protein